MAARHAGAVAAQVQVAALRSDAHPTTADARPAVQVRILRCRCASCDARGLQRRRCAPCAQVQGWGPGGGRSPGPARTLIAAGRGGEVAGPGGHRENSRGHQRFHFPPLPSVQTDQQGGSVLACCNYNMAQTTFDVSSEILSHESFTGACVLPTGTWRSHC